MTRFELSEEEQRQFDNPDLDHLPAAVRGRFEGMAAYLDSGEPGGGLTITTETGKWLAKALRGGLPSKGNGGRPSKWEGRFLLYWRVHHILKEQGGTVTDALTQYARREKLCPKRARKDYYRGRKDFLQSFAAFAEQSKNL